MFQRGRSIREAYDDHFMGGGNGREVTFHRVVNVVERRSPMRMMGGDFDRRGPDGPMYDEPMPYQNPRDYHGSRNYPPDDMQYFRRNPQRNDGPPSHLMHNRDDLRHHLDSRNNGRGGNFFRSRGRDSGREDNDYRRREHFGRDRSPVRRGNRSSSSSSKPVEKKSSSQEKPKPAAPASPPPPKSPKEEPPPSTTTPTTESPPASVAEPEEEAEAASVEPEPTPEPDLKARRVEAIKAKALEIEKDYRQDCETFRTVVKMLVEKEPSLDYLLQAPMEKNLEEMKERCLDSLKQFIKDLDQAIEPNTTEQPTEGET